MLERDSLVEAVADEGLVNGRGVAPAADLELLAGLVNGFVLAGQRDLQLGGDNVPALDGAVADRLLLGGGLAHLVEHLGDLLVRNFGREAVELEALVVGQLGLGAHRDLEGELDGLALDDLDLLEVGEIGLADDLEFFLLQLGLDERLDGLHPEHVAQDFGLEAALDDGRRSAARAEARDGALLGQLAVYLVEGPAHVAVIELEGQVQLTAGQLNGLQLQRNLSHQSRKRRAQ